MRSLFKVAPDQSSCYRRFASSDNPPHRSSISALLCERFWTFWTFFKRQSLRVQQKESEVDISLTRNHALKFHSAINLRFTTLRVMIYSRLTFDPRWKANNCLKFDWNGTLGNSRILWPLFLDKTCNAEDRKPRNRSPFHNIYTQRVKFYNKAYHMSLKLTLQPNSGGITEDRQTPYSSRKSTFPAAWGGPDTAWGDLINTLICSSVLMPGQGGILGSRSEPSLQEKPPWCF